MSKQLGSDDTKRSVNQDSMIQCTCTHSVLFSFFFFSFECTTTYTRVFEDPLDMGKKELQLKWNKGLPGHVRLACRVSYTGAAKRRKAQADIRVTQMHLLCM